MNEETKWELINTTETYEELASAIMIIAEEGVIRSNRQDKSFDAERQVRNAGMVIHDGFFGNILTRAYGIRQQALYIRYYEEKERNYVRDNSDQLDNLAALQTATARTDGGPVTSRTNDPLPPEHGDRQVS